MRTKECKLNRREGNMDLPDLLLRWSEMMNRYAELLIKNALSSRDYI